MSIHASILFFVCCAVVLLPGHCYQQPSLELNIVIKATNTSINETFFEDELKPFLTNLTSYLVFPEEVDDEHPEFARVAINIGGDEGSWKFVRFQNMTRSVMSTNIENLTLPYSKSNGNNQEAMNQALQRFVDYDSQSAALNRVTILMTDKVDASEANLEVAQKLRAISEYFFIIGIPSVENPTFENSMDAAKKLSSPSQVFLSIDTATSSTNGIPSIISSLMQTATRACHGIAFVYENSNYIDITLQDNYIKFVKDLAPSFASTDAVALISFDDLKNNIDGSLLLPGQKISQWNAKSSNGFDPMIPKDMETVYATLNTFQGKTTLPYLTIVILTQADRYHTSKMLSQLMDLFKGRDNVNVFVYNAGKTIPNDFYYLTKNEPGRIIDVQQANPTTMLDIYTKTVHPVDANHGCHQDSNLPTSTQIIPTTSSSDFVHISSLPFIFSFLCLFHFL